MTINPMRFLAFLSTSIQILLAGMKICFQVPTTIQDALVPIAKGLFIYLLLFIYFGGGGVTPTPGGTSSPEDFVAV